MGTMTMFTEMTTIARLLMIMIIVVMMTMTISMMMIMVFNKDDDERNGDGRDDARSKVRQISIPLCGKLVNRHVFHCLLCLL